MDSNSSQGRRGHVQGVVTIITFAPALDQGHRGLGLLPVPGKAPGACQSPSTPSETRGRGGVTLFKIHFLIYKCIRGMMWALFSQFASKGPRHVSTHRMAGMRGQDDSCTRSPSPEPCHGSWVCLPGPAPACPHPPAGLGAGGWGWGSLPVSAAQLPAVLVLTALGVIHLVHTETLLEVLGPDLGIQDLLSRAAGEPASLLVMQTLAEDPPCAGRAGGSELPQGPG